MLARNPFVGNQILRWWTNRHKHRLLQKSKQDSPKVLYVDTISDWEAQSNVNGMMKAYGRVSTLEAFDYRGLARRYGQRLMNQMLIRAAQWYQPDLIHLGKAESIKGETIHEIKQTTGSCVIHFYGDFRWEIKPHVVDIGQHADTTLLYHKDETMIQKYKQRGVRQIGFWWVGTDPEIFYPRPAEKRYDVIFMANNADFLEGHRKRRELIEAMIAEDIDLHLYGGGWEYLSDVECVHLHPFVNDEGFAQACSAAKITLGFNAVNNVRMYASWRRPFNSMASGAFHLTRYFPGLEDVFENGKHLVWFHSIPEAVEQIKYYLTHDEEREAIAAAGRQEVLAHHTWDDRIAVMLQYMQAAGHSKKAL